MENCRTRSHAKVMPRGGMFATAPATALALAFVLALAGGTPSAAQEGTPDRRMLDGNWVALIDSADGSERAFSFNSGSAVLVFQDAEGVVYARGMMTMESVTVEGAARIRVTLDDFSQIFVGALELEETVAQIFEMAPAGDSFDMWLPGEAARWGRLQRTNCGLELVWRQRDDTPPEGCAFLEVVGVGFDGLTGECTFYQDWYDNWEEIRRLPNGDLTPAACLITVPAG